MTVPLITVFTGDSPNRNTQDATTFTLNSINWLDYQLIQIVDTNASIVEINNSAVQINNDAIAAANSASSAALSENTALAASNFKGRWADATGAATVPSTYSNGGQTWQLLQDISDITADEPVDGAANWQVIDDINMSNVNESKLNNPLLHILAKNDLVRVMNGATELASERNTDATSIDINDVLRTVDIDDPREESSGWLFEGSGTNELTLNRVFNGAGWAEGGNGTYSYDNTDIFGVDGVTRPLKFTRTGAGGLTLRKTGSGILTGEEFSTAIWVYVPTGTDDTTYSVDYDNTDQSAVNTITEKDKWVRTFVTLSATGNVTNLDFNLIFGTGQSIYIDTSKSEEHPFATSDIITGVSPLPRDADDISIPVLGNFRESEGSIFLKADVIGDANTNQYMLHISDGTGNNTLTIRRDNSDKIILGVTTGGVSQVGIVTSFDMDVNTQYEIAVNYKDDDVELFVDGVSIGTDTSCTMPTGLTIINCGRAISGDELFGHIQDLRHYQDNLTLDEIKYLGGV